MLRVICVVLVMLFAGVSQVFAVDETAYVINTSGETLSKINLTTGEVTNDILTLGSDILCYPNQIVVRDSLAFVVASGTDEIQVINLNTEQTVGFIGTGANTNPYWMAWLNDRYCYVTLMTANSLAKIDMTTGTIVKEDSVGLSPAGVIIADSKAYVAITAFDFNTYTYGQGKVAVYDVHGDSVVSYFNVGMNPQYLARDMEGRIHVICTGDYWSTFGIVYVIEPTTDVVVDSVALGGSPGQITIGPDNIGYLAAGGWVTDGYVYSYNAATLEVYHDASQPILVDSGCAMVVAYQDSTLYEGNFKDYVVRMDSAGTVLEQYAVGDGPIHLDFNYLPGDFNGDFSADIADLTDLVDWLFRGGNPPRYPFWRGNIDGNEAYNVADVTYFVRYLFSGGPAPQVGATWVMP